jgi:serralysin
MYKNIFISYKKHYSCGGAMYITADPLQALLARGEFGLYSRWQGKGGQTVSLTYSFPSVLPEDYDLQDKPGFRPFTAEQKETAREVLASVSAIINVAFTEVQGEGDIRFAFCRMYEQIEGVVAYAYFPGEKVGGDIWFAVDHSAFYNDDGSPSHSFADTLTHELGHALGLKHPFADGGILPMELNNTYHTVMSYEDDLYAKGLMPFDIIALQHLYGANLNARAGDDVYYATLERGTDENGDDAYVNIAETIWDAGGNDTIDCLNFTSDCAIDLRNELYDLNDARIMPGVDSNGYHELVIARGVTIENAWSGSGYDWLYGNAADNWLWGGEGNDTLFGGWGADTLSGMGGNDIYCLDADTTGVAVIHDSGGEDALFLPFTAEELTGTLVSNPTEIWASQGWLLANIGDMEFDILDFWGEGGIENVIFPNELSMPFESFINTVAAPTPLWFAEDVYMRNKLQHDLGESSTQQTPETLNEAFLQAGFVFDTGKYEHFLLYGQWEDVSPTALFDPEYYYRASCAFALGLDADSVSEAQAADAKAAIADSGMNAWRHCLTYGQWNDISPSSLFDPAHYYKAKAADYYGLDISQTGEAHIAGVMETIRADGMNAWQHFLRYGMREGIAPSAQADAEAYRQAMLAAMPEGNQDLTQEQFYQMAEATGAYAAAYPRSEEPVELVPVGVWQEKEGVDSITAIG